MIVQIYEIQNIEEAKKIINLDVDIIGSVTTLEKCDELKPVIHFIKFHHKLSSVIPLTYDVKDIIEIANRLKPDILHLTPDLNLSINDQFKTVKILREIIPWQKINHVIPVKRKNAANIIDSFKIMKILESYVDYFIIDTYVEKETQKGFVGVTGKTCDWDIARKIVESTEVPIILAGGLNPDNVKEAIEKVRPWGVDSCSGTNQVDEDGNPIRFKKDVDRVREFVKNAKEWS